ncbi:hypothetical protein [Nocardia sp. NPDC005998]|uniref:hypothetical protein n=1 Tax=Nocardia sp. NPDC005998 TaxID=3156894 RepID=UPI0033A3D012
MARHRPGSRTSTHRTPPDHASAVPIFAIYSNERTDALLDPDTTAVHVVTGPLIGSWYHTPAQGAHAIVAHAAEDDHDHALNYQTTWRLHDRHTLGLLRAVPPPQLPQQPQHITSTGNPPFADRYRAAGDPLGSLSAPMP